MEYGNFDQKSRRKPMQLVQDELDASLAYLAEQMTNEEPEDALQLEPKQIKKQRVQQEIKNSITSFGKTMQVGVIKLFDALKELKTLQPELITEEVREDIIKFAALPKATENILQKIKKGIEENKSYKEIFGMSKATIEAFYQAAKYLYEQQRYQDAASAFQVLTFIVEKEPLFWIALGNSEYFCRHYDAALIAYALAGYIDPFDPAPHLYSCKCYEDTNQLDNAINALDLALIAMGDDSKDLALKQKTIEEQNRLRQKNTKG